MENGLVIIKACRMSWLAQKEETDDIQRPQGCNVCVSN
jgi:hypothetical protein